MAMARLKILTETEKRPSILIGAHDFVTADDRNYFNTLYAVASKHFQTPVPVGLHLGYGTDVMDALAHQFVGIFGGVALTFFRYAELLVEYDADRVNVGARLTLLNHVQGIVGLQGFDSIIAGASVNLRL